jgi:hypothetical protein
MIRLRIFLSIHARSLVILFPNFVTGHLGSSRGFDDEEDKARDDDTAFDLDNFEENVRNGQGRHEFLLEGDTSNVGDTILFAGTFKAKMKFN